MLLKIENKDYQYIIKTIKKHLPDSKDEDIIIRIYKLLKQDKIYDFNEIKKNITEQKYDELPILKIYNINTMIAWPHIDNVNIQNDLIDYFSPKFDLLMVFNKVYKEYQENLKDISSYFLLAYCNALTEHRLKNTKQDLLLEVFNVIIQKTNKKGIYNNAVSNIGLYLLEHEENKGVILSLIDNYYKNHKDIIFNDTFLELMEYSKKIIDLNEYNNNYPMLYTETLFTKQNIISSEGYSFIMQLNINRLAKESNVEFNKVHFSIDNIGEYMKHYSNLPILFIIKNTNNIDIRTYYALFNNEEDKKNCQEQVEIMLNHAKKNQYEKINYKEKINNILLEFKLSQNLSNVKTSVKKIKI